MNYKMFSNNIILTKCVLKYKRTMSNILGIFSHPLFSSVELSDIKHIISSHIYLIHIVNIQTKALTLRTVTVYH
jgi:hypothetical protein